MSEATLIKEIEIIDPESNLPVYMSVYQHPGGGVFALDTSYVVNVLGENEAIIPDPFVEGEYKPLQLSESARSGLNETDNPILQYRLNTSERPFWLTLLSCCNYYKYFNSG